MTQKAKAFVFQIPAVFNEYSAVLTLSEANQPKPFADRRYLAGYQGTRSPRAVARRLVPPHPLRGDRFVMARVVVRPLPDSHGKRTFDDGLAGLTVFDAEHAHTLTKTMVGEVWCTVTRALLLARGEPLSALMDADWCNPDHFIPAFPKSAAGVFELLPDLQIIVGLARSEITHELERVAVMPIDKVASLVEEAYVKNSDTRISLQGIGNDRSATALLLPGKKPSMH